MYCEKCSVVCLPGVPSCPFCGSRLREPEAGDFCFLTERAPIWGQMLAEVLDQHNITYVCKKALGAGLTIKAGSSLERYSYYVPYNQREQALSIVDELFTSGQDA